MSVKKRGGGRLYNPRQDVSHGSEKENQSKGGGEKESQSESGSQKESFEEINIKVKIKNKAHKEVDEKAGNQSKVSKIRC
jgi:hypothetical protein